MWINGGPNGPGLGAGGNGYCAFAGFTWKNAATATTMHAAQSMKLRGFMTFSIEV
jgi:hypothetical protein